MNAKKAFTLWNIRDKENTPSARVFLEWISKIIVAGLMMPFLILFFDTSFRTAYAASNLVGAYYALEFMLNEKLLASGFSSNNGPTMFCVLKVLPAIAVLRDMEFADTLIKVSMALWALIGAQLAFVPKERAKGWNLAVPLTPLTEALSKSLGQMIIGFVVFQAAVFLYDQPVPKAFGMTVVLSFFWECVSVAGRIRQESWHGHE